MITIVEDSLDDILRTLYPIILEKGNNVETTRGRSKELINVSLELSNPLARVSLTENRGRIFSGLGELIWILSGSSCLKFIEYYIPKYRSESEDTKTIYGAYGPRLFSQGIFSKNSQFKHLIQLLRKKSTTRKAVLQVFQARDIIGDHDEIPCTLSMQFLIRNKQLHCIVNMRSNDAYFGLPHDFFVFTMLQEIVACTLGIECGNYYHNVGSMHLYEKHFKNAEAYLDEGLQSRTCFMPPMPQDSIQRNIEIILKSEENIRQSDSSQEVSCSFREIGYWSDIEKLLLAFKHSKNLEKTKVKSTLSELSNNLFRPFIQKRI